MNKENHAQEAAMAMTEDPGGTGGPSVARGYMATFHLPNGCRLVARIADAVALSSSGNDTSPAPRVREPTAMTAGHLRGAAIAQSAPPKD